MANKLTITITGIKLVKQEMPKVAKRDLLIWRLNIVKHTQNVKIANAIDANINIVIHAIPITVESGLNPNPSITIMVLILIGYPRNRIAP